MSVYNFLDRFILLPLSEMLSHRSIYEKYREAREVEWYDSEQLVSLQNERIQKLVSHCYANVPYYTNLFDNLGITPDDIKSKEDLALLPVLTKQIIREHFDEFISKDIKCRRFIKASTGGSTGTPLQYYKDVSCWNAAWATHLRAWQRADIHLGDKLFTLAGNSLVSHRKVLSMKYFFDNVILRNEKHDCTDLTEHGLKECYDSLMKRKPAAIRGYASSLFFLARYIEERSLPVCDSVKAIFTTGEKLQTKYKITLQNVFNAPVFDGYGAADGGVEAHECEKHEGMHIDEDFCVIEIVDNKGNPVPDGEIGSVVSTDLNNYVFPFLRYKVGDLAYIKQERCSCGRSSRLLGEVIGREGKAIFTKEGRPFSSVVLDNMMFRNLDYHSEKNQKIYRKIDRFQIRQDKNGDITILIKPISKGEPASSFSYIIDNFSRFFVGSNVSLKLVDMIPSLPSGKEDYCYSEFKYQNGK